MSQTQVSPQDAEARSPAARTAGAKQELRDRLGVAPVPARGRPATLRARIVEGLKTLMWVAPLAVLLWIYAERSQLDKGENISASIQVKSTDPAHRIVTTDVKALSLDLAGPRASIEKVRDYLSNPSVRLDVLVPEEPFEGDISVAERLAGNDIFSREAVTVTKTRPATIRVKVEPRVQKTWPVRARPEDNFVGEAKFNPETVVVSGPGSLLNNLRPDQAFVDAIMTPFTGRKEGSYPEETVQLSVPFAPANESTTITFSPQTVQAKVEIKASEEWPIPSILVWFNLPAGAFDGEKYYSVQSNLMLNNVLVKGPKEAIDALKEGRSSAKVQIQLEPEDLRPPFGERARTLREDNFVLPEGVKLVTPPREPFKFNVQQRP